MATWNQWRIVAGLGGVHYEGIDHACLRATMDMLGIRPSRRRSVLLHVQVLESEAKRLRNEPP